MKLVMDDEKHRKEFEEVRKLCPWRSGKKCKPVIGDYQDHQLRNCTQKNCTPYYFKKFFERK